MTEQPIHHPDAERVKALIIELLSESKVSGWHVEVLEFDFYASSYRIKLGLGEHVVQTAILTEWLDAIWTEDGKFKRRKIKRALKEAVEPFAELEE